MSLEQNPSQSRTENPDIASTTHDLKAMHAQPAVIPPEANQDKSRRIGHLPLMIGGGAVAIAAIAGGYFATRGGDSSPAVDHREPGTSAPANPGETKTESDPAEYKGFEGLSAEKYSSDPEALGKAFYADMDTFFIAGATKEAADSKERLSMKDSEFVDEFSTEIDQAFIDTYFVKDWQQNPDLADYVYSLADAAHSARQARLGTYTDPANEPYVREQRITNITGTVDPLTTSIEWQGYDNRDKNNVEEYLDGEDTNTFSGASTLMWKEVDGELKIFGYTRDAE